MSKRKSRRAHAAAAPAAPAAPPSPARRRRHFGWLTATAVVVLVALGSGAWWAHRTTTSPPGSINSNTVRAAFVDEAGCIGCHAEQHRAWTGSHHDRAMSEANASSVLGDFSGTTFTRGGIKSRFFERDGGYWVNTDGTDGKLADFHVKDTFGVMPLQQYLLELPGGRLQALTIAWDVERKRWFDLYPNERVDAHDELHWTKPAHNWNFMCAECHSTDLKKNYDAAAKAYKTTFARIDVGCQACHGPASRHMEWAAAHKGGSANAYGDATQTGFDVDLEARDATVQIESCGRCHSRRSAFWGDYRYGARLMDTHLPALLEERLYHADGQILGEVYEYGSFLQSRMHAKGIRCSDCHDAHALSTRGEGNALCATCHNATSPKVRESVDTSGLKHKDYDSPAHHFHKPGSAGSQCVECHMPTRTYMVIDPRRDHSLRIPRPDLSVKLGTPNACNQCHKDRPPAWAAAAVARWYGPGRRQEAHYGEALWAGRTSQPGASAALAALARDGTETAIVRATALDLLRRYPGQAANDAFRDALGHSDPLLRRAALEGLEALPPAQRVALVTPLLSDPVRGVRMEAARLLAPVAIAEIGAAHVSSLNAALAEFEAAQRENADRPEGHLNLGSLYGSQRKTSAAEAEFRAAIGLDPRFVPAYVNLADLYRQQGAEEEAEVALREGLRAVPEAAPLHHALGLTLVREGRYADALKALARAMQLAPADPRYAYVYGVALHDTGRVREAIAVLESALRRHPNDSELLSALTSYARESGNTRAAAQYAERLQRLGQAVQ